MKIYLTGAAGYVGGFVLDELNRQGYNIRCLVRSEKDAELLRRPSVECVVGDVTDFGSFADSLDGCDAVIHLVAIIEEKKRKNITFDRINLKGTQNIVTACVNAGIERIVHMSALGADSHKTTPYYRTKGQAQTLVENSGLNYTIVRPSFIFGPGDAVYTMLAQILRLSPFRIMPVFGNGEYRHQPVHVKDVAEGMVSSISNPRTYKRTYDVGGPEALTYKEQLQAIARVMNLPIRFFPLPLPFSYVLIGAAGLFPFSPIDLDRLSMLTEDNVCDPQPFAEDLGMELTHFQSGLDYLKVG